MADPIGSATGPTGRFPKAVKGPADLATVKLTDPSGTQFNINIQNLKSGEVVEVNSDDKGLSVKKSGPTLFESVYQPFKRMIGDAGASTASFIGNLVDGAAGTDPVVSAQAALRGANGVLSQVTFAPQAVVDFVTNQGFSVFRAVAPALSGLKFFDTFRRHDAMLQAEDKQVHGLKKLFTRSQHTPGLVVDGVKFGLDVALAGAVVAALAHVGPLAGWMQHILAAGYTGDLFAAAFHGVGAATSPDSVIEGRSLNEKLASYNRTNGFRAMVKRVFGGNAPQPPQKPPQAAENLGYK